MELIKENRLFDYSSLDMIDRGRKIEEIFNEWRLINPSLGGLTLREVQTKWERIAKKEWVKINGIDGLINLIFISGTAEEREHLTRWFLTVMVECNFIEN